MTKVYSELAINYDKMYSMLDTSNSQERFNGKEQIPNKSLVTHGVQDSYQDSPDTLPLGAWVDDYETAYKFAKEWKAPEEKT